MFSCSSFTVNVRLLYFHQLFLKNIWITVWDQLKILADCLREIWGFVKITLERSSVLDWTFFQLPPVTSHRSLRADRREIVVIRVIRYSHSHFMKMSSSQKYWQFTRKDPSRYLVLLMKRSRCQSAHELLAFSGTLHAFIQIYWHSIWMEL